jgi:3-hydroxyacyl-CoA dehydrogenase
MNVLNHDTFDALEKALDTLEKDGKGLLIATEAEHFSAGADLAWMLATAQAAEWQKLDQMIARFQQLNLRLKSFHKPVVGAVNGYCLGGGAE